MTPGPLELMGVAIGADTPVADATTMVERLLRDDRVRVVEEICVQRNDDGTLTVDDLATDPSGAGDRSPPPRPPGMRRRHLLTLDDLRGVAASLGQERRALVVVLEHTWSAALVSGLAAIGGRVTFRSPVAPDREVWGRDHPAALRGRAAELARGRRDDAEQDRRTGEDATSGHARGRPGEAPGSSPPPDRRPALDTAYDDGTVPPQAYVDRLVALGMLYASGALTLSEFVTARRQVLGVLARPAPSVGGARGRPGASS